MKDTSKIKKWIHLWKKVQGRLNEETYLFVEDYLWNDEKSLIAEAEQWATDVNSIGNYSERGFQYGYKVLDGLPPKEWIEQKKKDIKEEIENKQEYLNFLENLKCMKPFDTFELLEDLNPDIKSGMVGVILEIYDKAIEAEFVKEDGSNYSYGEESTFTIDINKIKVS